MLIRSEVDWRPRDKSSLTKRAIRHKGDTVNTFKAIIISVIALVASSASADQPELINSGSQDLAVTLSQEQSEAVSLCVQKVLECGSTPETSAAPPAVRRKVGASADKIRQIRKDRTDRMQAIEDRLRRLENGAEVNQKDKAALRKDIDDLRAQLLGLENDDDGVDMATQEELDALRQELEQLGLREAANEAARDVTQLEDNRELKVILDRLNALEANIDPFEYGVYLAPNLVLATGGNRYSGIALTNQFTLRVSPEWDVIGEVSPIFAVSKAPFGTQARGAVGYRVKNTVRLELGLSSTWVEYNDQVKAKAMFLAGDLGLRYRAENGFSILGGLGVGSAFIADESSKLAFTGRLGIGYAR